MKFSRLKKDSFNFHKTIAIVHLTPGKRNLQWNQAVLFLFNKFEMKACVWLLIIQTCNINSKMVLNSESNIAVLWKLCNLRVCTMYIRYVHSSRLQNELFQIHVMCNRAIDCKPAGHLFEYGCKIQQKKIANKHNRMHYI